MRILNPQFIDDLKNGILRGIISSVKDDDTLDFQIREDEAHIYYRGGRILGIKSSGDHYNASFDKNYSKNKKAGYNGQLGNLPTAISTARHASQWVNAFPILKQMMDHYFAKIEKTEREFQQLVARENNNTKIANSTDYFILDIEYASKGNINMGRFDMVALEWPSITGKRKSNKADLAFIEMKFGENAIEGKADIKKHIEDMDAFLENNENLTKIQKEMAEVFKQKRELKLIKSISHNNNEVTDISNKKPDFILLIAGYTHRSTKLLNQLKKVPQMMHANLKVATANFMGYALYSNSIYDLDEFLEKFSDQIYTK